MRLTDFISNSLTDIRTTNLLPGEWWQLVDTINGKLINYTVEILAVTRDVANEYNRVIKVRMLLDSDHLGRTTGEEVAFTLSENGSPVFGKRIKAQGEELKDLQNKVDDIVHTRAIALETIAVLTTAKDKKYTLEIDTIVEYLIKIKLLDGESSTSYRSLRKYVRDCCKVHVSNHVKFYGTYAKLINLDALSVSHKAITNPSNTVKKVDLDKVIHGVKLLLESGLFGEIEIV